MQQEQTVCNSIKIVQFCTNILLTGYCYWNSSHNQIGIADTINTFKCRIG